ncbi:unnamed protein product [Calypogeia fissa]
MLGNLWWQGYQSYNDESNYNRDLDYLNLTTTDLTTIGPKVSYSKSVHLNLLGRVTLKVLRTPSSGFNSRMVGGWSKGQSGDHEILASSAKDNSGTSTEFPLGEFSW